MSKKNKKEDKSLSEDELMNSNELEDEVLPKEEEQENLSDEDGALLRVAELESALLRSAADLDNAMKRSILEVDRAHKYGVEKLLNELLPVLDNLEQALLNLSENSSLEDKEGIELTLKSFESALDKFGMRPIYPVNEDFNPEKHEAVTMTKDENKSDNEVGEVFQRGWELHNRVIRPARVTVIKN
ncbi:MAG: nucleotide exchange factor GrpE [SAR86 cluster bacterium]|jgi:molecular chaperone GrpE|uniref:Protein GrpE n=1 Tax=SAR86 cluster bacterium TaxID=2030880 RepID=A0A937JHE3_9GAMM|nr:nucleotide exchange factor GrpE [SAR86 cluster bacterium]MDG1202388.1 nucleotide exchange factor GrpE [SAR86 cluster bacterium]MDG1721267.1 nucleotide exchange factor GrpE [SAR86 cluster bacterium]